MSDIDVASLRAAAEAATPGPWGAQLDEYGDEWWFGGLSDGGQVTVGKLGGTHHIVTDAGRAADMAHIAAANPAVVLELLDRLAAAEAAVEILEKVRADEWDVDAPMPETTTPEWGTEDYRRHAVLFNDIGHCRTQVRLMFSDRMRLQRHLWALGWRRDVRDEDVTKRAKLVVTDAVDRGRAMRENPCDKRMPWDRGEGQACVRAANHEGEHRNSYTVWSQH